MEEWVKVAAAPNETLALSELVPLTNATLPLITWALAGLPFDEPVSS